MDIQTAITRCIDDLGLAPNTIKTYKHGLDAFLIYLRGLSPNPLDESSPSTLLKMEHFIYFLPWLNRNYSKQTSKVYGAAGTALLEWLVVDGQLEPTYQESIRYRNSVKRSHRRHEDRLPRWPQRDDVTRMLETVKIYNEKSPIKERNIALLETLASTGCRISEVLNLNIEDIDTTSRSAIVTGKGSKERRVFFSQSAIDALSTYWEARKSSMPTDPAFARHDKGAGKKRMKRITSATARTVVSQIAMVAGIDPTKFSPHYFRHAFAIRVLAETDNLALVQDLLGHANPNSTRVYAKIYPEDLRAVHNKIFG